MNNHFTIFRHLFLNNKQNQERKRNDLGLYMYSIKLKKKRFYQFISSQRQFDIANEFEQPITRIIIEFCLKSDPTLLKRLENYIIKFDILINDVKN